MLEPGSRQGCKKDVRGQLHRLRHLPKAMSGRRDYRDGQSLLQAVEAIERGNYGQAKDILISAEQRCEAQYLEASETPGGNNTVPST